MTRFSLVLTRAVEWSMGALLAIMVVLVFANAAGRYLFATGFPEGEEIARLCFVWLIFLGAALAVRERAHIGINILVNRFSPAGKKAALFFVNMLALYALWLFAEGSWKQTAIGLQSRTAVTGIPHAAYAFSGLVCAVAMAGLYLIDLARLVTGHIREDELIQVQDAPPHEEMPISAGGPAKSALSSGETRR
jgi:TRAP-type C4-dicarboxylate transport system permease small subunit